MTPNDRRDEEIWNAWGQIAALEIAVTALLNAHPDRDALRRQWRDAQDAGFMQTSDVVPQVGERRLQIFREGYLAVLARLRAAAGDT